MSLRIGTRRSALALAQARTVAKALDEDVELVEVVTSGDRGEATADKSRWVTELERALLAGDIDAAVHSAKDVPGELPEGLAIMAVPARADARDAVCGADSLDALADGARVGTSSLRRAAQLRGARPDLEVTELRGNVDTRLRKLAEGEWDAIVLALAGLQRLGREDEAGAVLDPAVFVPAPGQGALAIEGRAGDTRFAALDDELSHACLRAERAAASALGADCHSAFGAHATPGTALTGASGGRDHSGTSLTAYLGAPDGSASLTDRLQGDDPEALGRAVAKRMLAAGARELLP